MIDKKIKKITSILKGQNIIMLCDDCLHIVGNIFCQYINNDVIIPLKYIAVTCEFVNYYK